MPTVDGIAGQHQHTLKKRQSGQKPVRRPVTLLRRVTPSQPGIKTASSNGSVNSNDEEESVDGANTFQQFCASCEKQILVSNPSVLYCSEKCRDSDSSPQSLRLFNTDVITPHSPYNTTAAFELFPIRDIVPQLSPTPSHNPSLKSCTSREDELRFAGIAVVGESLGNRPRRPVVTRMESEAMRYLAQFRSQDRDRPWYRRNSSTASGEGAPSLSYTPTSSTTASVSHTPGSYMSNALYAQPLRTNPRWNSTSFSPRSVELVTPISHSSSVSTVLATSSAIHGNPGAGALAKQDNLGLVQDQELRLSYAKSSAFPGRTGRSSGNLKQLFNFDEMRAQPK